MADNINYKKAIERIRHAVWEQLREYREKEGNAVDAGDEKTAEKFYHMYMASLSIYYMLNDEDLLGGREE